MEKEIIKRFDLSRPVIAQFEITNAYNFTEIPYGDTDYYDARLFDYGDAAKVLSGAIVDTNMEGGYFIYKWDGNPFKYAGKKK